MNDQDLATKLIGCLDLTSLNTNDTEDKIIDLCKKAVTPYGNVASVCIYPQWISLAKKQLKKTNIKVATVINFPEGGNDLVKLKEEIKKSLNDGADELDIVFPYHEFLQNNIEGCRRFLEIIQREYGRHNRKIILETGELKHTSKIEAATKLCLDYNPEFIKTSTGKTPVSATIGAANIILETIRNNNKSTGFKASGGIKNFEEARKYFMLSEIINGQGWATPNHFRIGASSLLDDLLNKIAQH